MSIRVLTVCRHTMSASLVGSRVVGRSLVSPTQSGFAFNAYRLMSFGGRKPKENSIPPEEKRGHNRHHRMKIPEELTAFVDGRGRHERRDSITMPILEARAAHAALCDEQPEPTQHLVECLADEGFGSKQRLFTQYVFNPSAGTGAFERSQHTPAGSSGAGIAAILNDGQATSDWDFNQSYWEEEEATEAAKTGVGAGGFGQHLTSCSENWPLFQHMLPEIALAGHSNSGKSTLVNALIGVLPRLGPAKVSDRAGWTDQICFYKLGKKPPVVTLVDFPGYGHAIASSLDREAWSRMVRSYLSERPILSRCLVLVDAGRGLCSQDKSLLRSLNRAGIPWCIVLTKADLLSVDGLARSMQVVANALVPFVHSRQRILERRAIEANREPPNLSVENIAGDLNYASLDKLIWPISSSTGAGVNSLWYAIRRWVDLDSTPFVNARSVREHVLAREIRKRRTVDPPKRAVKLSNRALKGFK